MDKSEREQRYERRAGKAPDSEQGMEREQQYNTAESEADNKVQGGPSGSRRPRSISTRRNRSPSVGKNAIVDVKLSIPVFKGSKKADPDVHIQAFEQWAKLKGMDSEEYGDYFPTTLKESAQKWYYHYPPAKLPTYESTKRAFLLRFRDEVTDEDILCDLGKIKQKRMSVRKYVEKLKDLTRQLECQPSDKNFRAWFLNGCSNKRLKRAEITNATASFEELVARALKMETNKRKTKHQKGSSDESDSSASSSSESESTRL